MRRVLWLVGGAALIALAVGSLWLRGGRARWAVQLPVRELGVSWRLADQGRVAAAMPISGFSPTGRTLYADPVEVRDCETGQLLRTIWGKDLTFRALEASPHGPWVAGLVRDPKPSFQWANTRTGETRSLQVPGEAGHGIHFSPLGDLVFFEFHPGKGEEHLLAVHLHSGEQAGQLRRTEPRDDFEEVSFGGHWLFLLDGNAPARVVIWDCLARKQAGSFRIVREKYSDAREQIEASPDGRLLMAWRGPDDPVQVWRIDAPAKPSLERAVPPWPWAGPERHPLGRSPCGRWVAGLMPDEGSRISILDTATANTSEAHIPEGWYGPVRFSEGGTVWLSRRLEPEPASGRWAWLPVALRSQGNPTHGIAALDPPSGRITFQMGLPERIDELLPLPDGSGVIIVEGDKGPMTLSRHDVIPPAIWPAVLALLAGIAGVVMLAISAWPRRKATA